MSEINLYVGNYIGKEEEIFKALREVKSGELLPSDGLLGFFYESINNPSTTLFLKTGKKTKFFYADHDEFICAIMEQAPRWILDIDKNILRLNLIYESGDHSIPIVFIFDIAREEYRSAIKLIAKNGIFDLYFLSFLYGGFVLEKRVKYEVPKSIIKTFKSIK